MVQDAKQQDTQSRKRVVRIMTLISLTLFLGHTGYYMGRSFFGGVRQAQPPEAVEANAESQLQIRERGYELVLQREPENQAALEGLFRIRLDLNDADGAIEPLEMLIELNPEREDYREYLKELKGD